MNRSLGTALVLAAVVGATAGATVAVTVGRDEPGPTSATDPVAGGRAEEVLWVSQRELHDGETVVRLDLVQTPASVERAEVGWVVTERASPQEPAFSALTVRPDGSAVPLADTFGDGDVSPDGSRYVAMRRDGSGYGVWDVATGEEVDSVDAGVRSGQSPSGGAQFIDDETAATTWVGADGRYQVLAGRLGTRERRLVTDGLVGQWRISPDGRWIAGTARVSRRDDVPDCAATAPVSPPAPVRTDCDSRFVGAPAFAADSSAVLAVSSDTGSGPASLRTLPTEEQADPVVTTAPEAFVDGVHLDAGRIVVLSATNAEGDGTLISLCEPAGSCEVVETAGDAAQTAVLGRQG